MRRGEDEQRCGSCFRTPPRALIVSEVSRGRAALFKTLPGNAPSQPILRRPGTTGGTGGVAQLRDQNLASSRPFFPGTPRMIDGPAAHLGAIKDARKRVIARSPGALSGTINIDLLTTRTGSVHTSSMCNGTSVRGWRVSALIKPTLRFTVNRLSRCSPLYFIESNTSAGHCPAINHRLRAARGK